MTTGDVPARVIGYATATSGYRDNEQARRMAILEPMLPPGVRIEPVALPGPEFLDRAEDFDTAIAAAAAWAADLPPDRYDVLISAGALDPGLPTLRRLAPMPVIGPGEASLFIGHALGRPLSIVTVDEHAVAKTPGFIEQTATKPEVVSVRSIDFPVRRIVSDLEGGREALRREARAAVEFDGAGTIMLGAMTLGTLGLDEELRRDLDVWVVNPLQAAIDAAVAALRGLGLAIV
jgi:Asp/Glu/hydantoin racemase